MFRNRGWPKGAADSRTWEPTNHWSALSRRKAAPTSQCFAATNPLYPPKLGDKNLTGIQPCAYEVMGVAAAPKRTAIRRKGGSFYRVLKSSRIFFPPPAPPLPAEPRLSIHLLQ